MNWTGQGISTIKDLSKRRAAAKALIEKAGGKDLGLYLTFGQYDAVGIVQFPNDEVAASVLLAIGIQGNLRTTTLKAFSESEFAKIIEKLP